MIFIDHILKILYTIVIFEYTRIAKIIENFLRECRNLFRHDFYDANRTIDRISIKLLRRSRLFVILK